MFRGNQLVRRFCLVAVAAVSFCLLAGFDANEADQRRAFIGILKKEIIDHPDTYLLELGEEERIAIGPYGDHFDFIVSGGQTPAGYKLVLQMLDCYKSLDALEDLSNATEREEFARTMDRKIAAARETLKLYRTEKKEALARLYMPDDLKPVFDRALKKVIKNDADGVIHMLTYSDYLLADMQAQINYLKAHPDKIKTVDDLMSSYADEDSEESPSAFNDFLNDVLDALSKELLDLNPAH